jgi:hypothetical protein
MAIYGVWMVDTLASRAARTQYTYCKILVITMVIWMKDHRCSSQRYSADQANGLYHR